MQKAEWLSEKRREAKHKQEKERYTQLNAELNAIPKNSKER